MSAYNIALAIHLIGNILWLGGVAMAALTALGLRASAGEQAAAAGIKALRRALLALAAPGLLLAWIGGLWVLLPNFGAYRAAGWMHGKLTLIVVMTALTGVFTGRMRRAAAGQAQLGNGLLLATTLVAVLGAATVVVLAVLKPF